MIEILRLQFQITISFKNKIRFENNSFLSPKNTNLEKLNFSSLRNIPTINPKFRHILQFNMTENNTRIVVFHVLLKKQSRPTKSL